MSSKGKTPWMSLNGEATADSQFCIDRLTSHFDLDLDSHLTSEQRGLARAVRALVEENLYWTMCYESFIRTPSSLDVLLEDILSRWQICCFKRVLGLVIRLELWGQGVGRHGDTEIGDIARRDLHALADILGNKPFMLGDTLTEIDCTVFGMLAMVVWQMKGSRHEAFVHEDLPSLVRYCHRVKERLWPDWESR